MQTSCRYTLKPAKGEFSSTYQEMLISPPGKLSAAVHNASWQAGTRLVEILSLSCSPIMHLCRRRNYRFPSCDPWPQVSITDSLPYPLPSDHNRHVIVCPKFSSAIVVQPSLDLIQLSLSLHTCAHPSLHPTLLGRLLNRSLPSASLNGVSLKEARRNQKRLLTRKIQPSSYPNPPPPSFSRQVQPWTMWPPLWALLTALPNGPTRRLGITDFQASPSQMAESANGTTPPEI